MKENEHLSSFIKKRWEDENIKRIELELYSTSDSIINNISCYIKEYKIKKNKEKFYPPLFPIFEKISEVLYNRLLLLKNFFRVKLDERVLFSLTLNILNNKKLDEDGREFIKKIFGLILTAQVNVMSVIEEKPLDIKINSNILRDMYEIEQPIDFLGYNLRKGIIRMESNVGNYLGLNMSGGVIEVNGNAGYGIAYGMRGGRICVSGKSSSLGRFMSGGQVRVENGVRGNVGQNMSGGEINVYGIVSGNVGQSMSGGEINVFGRVYGIVGLWMDSGKIYIRKPDTGKICLNTFGGVILLNEEYKNKNIKFGQYCKAKILFL